MLVICALLFVINTDLGIPFQVKGNVEGKIIRESDTKYLVDFSKGIKKFNITGKPEDYKKVLIDKTECVKE